MLKQFLSRLGSAWRGMTERIRARWGKRPRGRGDLPPDDREKDFQDDKEVKVVTDWAGGTFYHDEDAARNDGYEPDNANYRGLFFSMRDAEEYARTIGLPVVFVKTETGIEVYIDYEEEV